MYTNTRYNNNSNNSLYSHFNQTFRDTMSNNHQTMNQLLVSPLPQSLPMMSESHYNNVMISKQSHQQYIPSLNNIPIQHNQQQTWNSGRACNELVYPQEYKLPLSSSSPQGQYGQYVSNNTRESFGLPIGSSYYPQQSEVNNGIYAIDYTDFYSSSASPPMSVSSSTSNSVHSNNYRGPTAQNYNPSILGMGEYYCQYRRRSSTNTSRSSSPSTCSYSSLNVDLNTAPSPASNKRYGCHICNKRFTRPSSLTTHMYSHTGEKPFRCPVSKCHRQFSVVSNLRRHAKVHQNDPIVKNTSTSSPY